MTGRSSLLAGHFFAFHVSTVDVFFVDADDLRYHLLVAADSARHLLWTALHAAHDLVVV